MLYLAGVSDRRGKVGEGNTVCDYDPEEIRRKASISAASAPLEWKNKKINLLDAPGLFDFEGGMCEAMRAADTALIVVSGRDGRGCGHGKGLYRRREKRPGENLLCQRPVRRRAPGSTGCSRI